MQNQIINMCRVLIGPNAVVTDDQINDAIERVSLIFPNMDIAQVKSEFLVWSKDSGLSNTRRE